MSFDEAFLRLDAVLVEPELPIIRAVRRLDAAGTGALLVAGPDGVLQGLVADGDIRRAMLRGVSFDDEVVTIARRDPMVAAPDVTPRAALRLMDAGLEVPVNQLPLVDAGGRAVGLILRRDLVNREELGLSALIMAGGLGSRMLPLTERTPKPMLPVGNRPLLERTIESLEHAGIRQVAISTMHLADRISAYFGDGHALGVNLQYVTESQPLGTAGALRAMDVSAGPLLVVNGDILTSLSFSDLAAFHRREGAELTVAMRRCELRIPFGVLECDGARVRGMSEKPLREFWINGGIYIVEPTVRDLIPADTRFDMTELIERMLREGRRVAGFPILEYWLDIGQPADYLRAQVDLGEERVAV